MGPGSAECSPGKLLALGLCHSTGLRRETMGLMVPGQQVPGECPADDLPRGSGEDQEAFCIDSYSSSWSPPSPSTPAAHTSSAAASSRLSTPRGGQWSVGAVGLARPTESTAAWGTQHCPGGVPRPDPTPRPETFPEAGKQSPTSLPPPTVPLNYHPLQPLAPLPSQAHRPKPRHPSLPSLTQNVTK